MKILEIRSWKFSSRSTPKGKNRAMVSSENEAGPLRWTEQDRSVKVGSLRGV